MISFKTFMGGGAVRPISQDLNLVRGSSRVQLLEPSIMGLIVNLPFSSTLRLGAPQFYIVNSSTMFSVDVKDGLGTQLIQLMPESAVILGLIRDTCSTNHWFLHSRPLVGRAVGREI